MARIKIINPNRDETLSGLNYILKSHLKTALKVRKLRNQMISMIPITGAGS
jgi:hypothetical protein